MSSIISTRPRARVLVVDDEPDIARMLGMCLQADGHSVVDVTTIQAALAHAEQRAFDVIFLDLRLGTENGLDAIAPLLATSPWVRVIVITAYASVDSAVEAMKRGATDYLPKPFTPSQVRLVVRKAVEAQVLAQRSDALAEALAGAGPGVRLETSSAPMRQAIELARHAAAGRATVLLRGEPGVGKRTLARAIHAWSERAERPLGVAPVRAPSAAHLEAEWFGTARKMPGGKVLEQPGRAAYCDGGTLLIEDVDLLPITFQPKLLRLIQQQQYERPADFMTKNTDLRVVSTTTADLHALVGAGTFIADLQYALSTVLIDLPPLRQRPDDIEVLAGHFLAFFARQTRRPVVGFTDSALVALHEHSWPGNVRELRNCVERAVLVCRGELVEPTDLPRDTMNKVNSVALGDPVPLERIEELHIRGVLAASPSLEAAAATLGMDTVTLWRRRKQYGI